jgi:hypothetical protein
MGHANEPVQLGLETWTQADMSNNPVSVIESAILRSSTPEIAR